MAAPWHLADPERLRSIALLCDVPQRALVLAGHGMHIGSFSPGQLILKPDERAGVGLLIADGLTRLYSYAGDGTEITCVMVVGRWGERCGLVWPALASQSGVQALDDRTLVCRLTTGCLRNLVGADQSLATRMSAALARQVEDASDLALDLAIPRLAPRLAHTLERLARAGRDGAVRLTHEELASIVRATPDEVTRQLAALRRAGLIAFKPHSQRYIHVLDSEGLLSFSEN